MKTPSTIPGPSSPAAHAALARLQKPVRTCNQEDFLRLLGAPQLKDTEAASLSVVLKRDKDTQLTLNVQLRHGHYEVVAVLERSDSSAPNADWERLRIRLAERGICLTPLVSSRDHASWYAAGDFSSVPRRRHPVSHSPLHVLAAAKSPAYDPGVLTLLAAADARGRLN